MYRELWILMAVLASVGRDGPASPALRGQKPDPWTRVFAVDKAELSLTGRNPYFILQPWYRQVFESGAERLVVTVLNETRRVDDVTTRVVEERETKNSELVEVSRNYFAISARTHSVYYFGLRPGGWSGSGRGSEDREIWPIAVAVRLAK